MINNDKMRIGCISALISPGCNLQCSYCEMAKNTKPEDKKQLWIDNQKALEDGTFVANIVKTLRRLKQPINIIDSMEFWGQEPTLTLPIITENWKNWTDNLPGIKKVFFSTNGMTDSDIIFDFFKSVDENSSHPMFLGVQISYDGKYGEEEIRGGDSDYILNNFIKLQEKINNYCFKNVKEITFNTHAVMSVKLIEHLNSIYKIEEYFNEYEIFLDKLYSVANNKIIHWAPAAFLSQNCYSATTQDGINFDNFIKMVNTVKKRGKYPLTLNINDEDFVMALCGYGGDDLYENISIGKYKNFNDFINKFLSLEKDHPYMFNSATCSASVGDLKIMYDGTFLQCQNLMFDTKMDINLLGDTVSEWSRYYLLNKGQLVNGITSSDEELNKYFYYINQLQGSSRMFATINSLCNLIYLCSINGQIDPSYKDDKSKIKRHAFILSRILNCPYNCQVLTGSTFLRQIGEIRQFCNGALDRVDKIINNTIMEINGENNG